MKQPNSTVKTLIGPIESIQGIPEYKTGLGYSPASGPAVGRPIIGSQVTIFNITLKNYLLNLLII